MKHNKMIAVPMRTTILSREYFVGFGGRRFGEIGVFGLTNIVRPIQLFRLV